ncbi:MAG: hypothetical protein WC851_03025 [Candidatus Shapirobacteria bacterium]|jgi:hypothetical protein
MAKIIDTDIGKIVVYGEVLRDGDLKVGDEYRWLSRVDLADGSSILVIAPSDSTRVDLVIGHGGQILEEFSAPVDRTSTFPPNQYKLSNLQAGDEIVYRTSAKSEPVRLTFTPKS